MLQIASGGKCEMCGKSYRKSGMTRHLQSCLAKTGPHGESLPRRRNNIHLFVEDTYRPEYWMHLAAPERCTLEELDQYLRDTWLECCGHLSSFFVGRVEYKWQIFEMDEIFAAFRERELNTMEIELRLVAPPRTEFSHWYDYGTTTELRLRSLGEATGYKSSRISRLARNDAPAIDCSMCGAPATWVGPSDDDWIAMTAGLCDNCAPASDDRLPVVNSPRCGVCAYDGVLLRIIDDDDAN